MAARNYTGLNEMFDLLTHPHRRYVLHHLTQKSDTVDFDTLAASLAQDAGQTEGNQSTSSTRIEVGLQHMHLPKLVDAGVITFDEDTGIIELIEANGHVQFIDQAARIDGYAPPAAGD